ncbi:MAG: LysR family transcriptional regulator [Lachnospiraceae bacterium]|nr:LysR family transcriptional regulator [Lachnospiraceae bacterium]
MINFLNLEYYLVAAEELNFTRAAKKLYISQQSLSNHIANLEREYGIALFDRTTPLTLTYAGKVLMHKAREMLDLREETAREIADIKDFNTGQLTIGLSHTRGRKILPEILPAYTRRFPNIQLRLVEGNSEELDLDLLHGDIDLSIGMLPFRVEDVETVPICEEEVLLVVSDGLLKKEFPGKFPEVKSRLSQDMDIRLLEHCPFVLINPGNSVRIIANEILEEAQITPRIVLETENIDTALALAGKGMGITFYPRMLLAGREGPISGIMQNLGLNCYSINHPKAHGVLAIGYHKGRYLSRATKEFIRLAKETIIAD